MRSVAIIIHVIVLISRCQGYTVDSLNPVTLGTMQLGRNSEVAAFQEIAAA